MLPKIVVAGRSDDALGKTLASTDDRPFFVLEFCHNREALVERLCHERPAALVVGLRSRRSGPVIALVRHVKTHCPDVPVVVACLDQITSGRDVLNMARAGAEHFAFDQIDNFDDVLRTLVAPDGGGPESDPSERGGGPERVDELGLARARAKARRTRHRIRYGERTPAASLAILPPTTSPLLRRIILACLGPVAPPHVAALADHLGLSRRSLERETARRRWPSPRTLLQWGRLFRGAIAGVQARIEGDSWPACQLVIARAAGYRTGRTASRAYHARAGISLRDVWQNGASALLPAFIAATDTDVPPNRLAC